MGLEIKSMSYNLKGINIHKYELQKQITQVRKDVKWLEDVPAETLNSTMDRLDRAYTTFFRTFKKGGGYPRFATKKNYKSIHVKTVYVDGDYVITPKIGMMKMFKDSEIKGSPKTAQIIKEPTGYFICIQCENVPAKFVSESQAIGLDMGLSHFCIDSNGGFISNPRHFKKYERRLRTENRSLSRKKKGSNSWKKQAKKLATLHHKIGNVRRDFLHKESTRIAKANSTVYMEDLNVKGMAKNTNLSKHILDAGWGMFRELLSYKTNVVLVNSRHTSQTCNDCGAVDSKSRVSRSNFICTSCGHVSNADVNAAMNILSRGAALSR